MVKHSCSAWLLLAIVTCLETVFARAAQIIIPPEAPACRENIILAPYCKRNATEEEKQAPGIGLVLDFAHATAAVRYHNGSIQNVAFLDGDPIYVKTMVNLADAGDSRALDDELLKVLATMLGKLRAEVETMLLSPVTGATVTIPDQIELAHKEFNSILHLASIWNIMDIPEGINDGARYRISAVAAAYAGRGMGLCKNYLDFFECRSQELCLPVRRVLQIDYSATSLSGVMWHDAETYKASTIFMSTFFNSTLGASDTPKGDDLREKQYWLIVRRTIVDFLKSLLPSYMDYLILTGTSATHPMIRAILEDALMDILPRKESHQALDALLEHEEQEYDPVWLTARGAAEIAKRRQEGPYLCKPDTRTEEEKRQLREETEAYCAAGWKKVESTIVGNFYVANLDLPEEDRRVDRIETHCPLHWI